MKWSEDEVDEEKQSSGFSSQERCLEFNGGASANIRNLHRDRPDVQRRVDKAFQILFQDSLEVKFSNEVILETLLTVLENCGDYEVQVSAMKILLGRDHVFCYKKWFAKAWFDGKPLTTQAFLALRQPFDEEDVLNFLNVYNREPVDFGFVFSIRCSLVSWNHASVPLLLKGSPYLHLNCGTKTLLVTGVTPPPECNKRNLFFFHGGEITKAIVFHQHLSYRSPLQGLSIYTSKGQLVVHPDPPATDENWQKIREFLMYISNVPLETSLGKEEPEAELDINGNVNAESNFKHLNVNFHDTSMNCKTENVTQPSFAHVSSSQDDYNSIPEKVETHEVAVQVICIESEEMGTATTPNGTLDTFDNPAAPVEGGTVDCLPSDLASPVSPLHHGSDISKGIVSLDMSRSSEHTTASPLSESPKVLKHSRKKPGRKHKTSRKPEVQDHPDEMGHPMSESECSRKEACRRFTRSLIKEIGADLQPGFNMYAQGKKRKSSICTAETSDVTGCTPMVAPSETCDHPCAADLEPANKVAKSEICPQEPVATAELKLEDAASEFLQEQQTNCFNEYVDEPAIRPHPHSMPTLMTPYATPQREMTDFVNNSELNKSEGVVQDRRVCGKDVQEQGEDQCSRSGAEDDTEEQKEQCRNDGGDKCTGLEQARRAKGPPPVIPLNSSKRLLNNGAGEHHQSCSVWKVEIEPCNMGFEGARVSPRAMDSSSDTSFNAADNLDSAVLLPTGDSDVTEAETFSFNLKDGRASDRSVHLV